MLDTTRPDTPRDAANDSTVSSGFAELVYADPAWLDAEFDAIMTANFGVRFPSPCPPPQSLAAQVRGEGATRPAAPVPSPGSSMWSAVAGRVGVGGAPLRGRDGPMVGERDGDNVKGR
jgi:hypothetical protein